MNLLYLLYIFQHKVFSEEGICYVITGAAINHTKMNRNLQDDLMNSQG